MAPTQEQIEAGKAICAPLSLRAYVLLVHGVSNHWIWRCPIPQLLRLYNRNVSASQVYISVGTGNFLAHAHWPVPGPSVTRRFQFALPGGCRPSHREVLTVRRERERAGTLA